MASDPATVIRRATVNDATPCARLLAMASHGLAEAVFAGLLPGQSTERIIAEHRIKPEGKLSSFRNWWVADAGQGVVAGGANMYPLDGTRQSAREDMLTEDRLRILRPMIELDAEAAGTFFINIVAVFPPYRRGGVARRMIGLAHEQARAAALPFVSLTTFEHDVRLVDYYRRIGFAVVASRPLERHERLLVAGDLVLMMMPTERLDPSPGAG